jgi:uracil-DNA glycosylase
VIVALGSFAWTAAMAAIERSGAPMPRPRPRFGHGAEAVIEGWTVVGSFHPSQQNTFTGTLTEDMLDAVLIRARECAGLGA